MNIPQRWAPEVGTQPPLFQLNDQQPGAHFGPSGAHRVPTFSAGGHPTNNNLTSSDTARVPAGAHFWPNYAYSSAKKAEKSAIGSNDVKSGHPGTPVTTLKDLKALAGHTTGRGTHATRCATCHQPILTGLDADRLAIQANIDWTPLDETGELQALLAGRRTYVLDLQPGGNPKLTRRTPAMIRRPIKKWMRADIVPAHQCGAPPLPTIPTRLITEIVEDDPNTPPPF